MIFSLRKYLSMFYVLLWYFDKIVKDASKTMHDNICSFRLDSFDLSFDSSYFLRRPLGLTAFGLGVNKCNH